MAASLAKRQRLGKIPGETVRGMLNAEAEFEQSVLFERIRTNARAVERTLGRMCEHPGDQVMRGRGGMSRGKFEMKHVAAARENQQAAGGAADRGQVAGARAEKRGTFAPEQGSGRAVPFVDTIEGERFDARVRDEGIESAAEQPDFVGDASAEAFEHLAGRAEGRFRKERVKAIALEVEQELAGEFRAGAAALNGRHKAKVVGEGFAGSGIIDAGDDEGDGFAVALDDVAVVEREAPEAGEANESPAIKVAEVVGFAAGAFREDARRRFIVGAGPGSITSH